MMPHVSESCGISVSLVAVSLQAYDIVNSCPMPGSFALFVHSEASSSRRTKCKHPCAAAKNLTRRLTCEAFQVGVLWPLQKLLQPGHIIPDKVVGLAFRESPRMEGNASQGKTWPSVSSCSCWSCGCPQKPCIQNPG